MIFCFSATGNSLWVAKQLGKILNEKVVSVTEILRNELSTEFDIHPEEKVGFVFPVHSWGPPTLLLRFIKNLKLNKYSNQQVFAVCTCGDDAGYTNRLLSKSLYEKDIYLESCHIVPMPNTYILFPFFDIDKTNIRNKKLLKATEYVQNISKAIIDRKQDNSLYIKGFAPRLKSYVIYPLFIKHTYGKNKFHITDKCIHCGICDRICPTKNISLKNGKPIWSQNCVQCLACIHRCPVKAIEYGKITLKKGRYHHSDI